jgi:para-aminobenzoate synthetase component 1
LKTSLTVTDLNIYSIIPLENSLLKFSEVVSARAYYKNHYVDLVTSEVHAFQIEGWIAMLDFQVQSHVFEKRFVHLFYELGFLFESLTEEISSHELLAVDIQYGKIERNYSLVENKKIELVLKAAPHYSDYEKKFNDGYDELKAGNCYQFNLTGEYVYGFDEGYEAHDFISALWKKEKSRGAYASATYIGSLNKLFLSNSPECLFDYEKGVLTSRPIKGTMKRSGDLKTQWKELSSDVKSQAELFMIADLMRNDLSRIDLPQAVVAKKKAMLLVPGLIHQYSEIKIKLRRHVSLKNILEKIFPGGSITGAPKKGTMQILRKIEGRTRGFYCGSTLLFSPGKIVASINIRSSVIDFEARTLSYQAGGGITLLSDAKNEFDEMTYKHDSYIDILTL